MNHRILLITIVAAALAIPGSASAGELPPSGPFPDRPCTLASRMNVYHAPDGTIWECVCEALSAGHVCDWYEQGWAEPLATRKRHHITRPLHKTIAHRVVIRIRPVIA